MFSKLFILPIVTVTLLVASFTVVTFDFAWFYIFPIIGLIFLIAGGPAIVFLYYRNVPPAARMLVRAVKENKPLLVIMHDSGRCAFHLIKERLGEGIVKTETELFKLLPHFVPDSGLAGEILASNNPNPTGNPNGETGLAKKISKMVEGMRTTYSDYVTKKSMLIGLNNLPIWFAYSGSMCLLNPIALAFYEAGEMYIRTAEGSRMFKKEVMDEMKTKTKADREEQFKKAFQPLLLLALTKIGGIVGGRFSVSQIGALIVESEKIGEFGRARGMISGKMLGLIIILIVIIGLAAAFLMFGPQLLSGLGLPGL